MKSREKAGPLTLPRLKGIARRFHKIISQLRNVRHSSHTHAGDLDEHSEGLDPFHKASDGLPGRHFGVQIVPALSQWLERNLQPVWKIFAHTMRVSGFVFVVLLRETSSLFGKVFANTMRVSGFVFVVVLRGSSSLCGKFLQTR